MHRVNCVYSLFIMPNAKRNNDYTKCVTHLGKIYFPLSLHVLLGTWSYLYDMSKVYICPSTMFLILYRIYEFDNYSLSSLLYVEHICNGKLKLTFVVAKFHEFPVSVNVRLYHMEKLVFQIDKELLTANHTPNFLLNQHIRLMDPWTYQG